MLLISAPNPGTVRERDTQARVPGKEELHSDVWEETGHVQERVEEVGRGVERQQAHFQ